MFTMSEERPSTQPIGIKQIAGLQRFVHDLSHERWLLCNLLDFEEIASSTPALEAQTGQRSAVFRAGSCTMICSQPLSRESAAGRFLQLHPEGVGAILLDVQDVERAFSLVERLGGTPVSGIERDGAVQGGLATFAMATPLNDVRLYLVERRDHPVPLPGFTLHEARPPAANRCRLLSYDHITSNFQTMAPAAMWLERILGFRPFWSIQFHTGHGRSSARVGSGLRSVVMWDERSEVKFALNEPAPPNFEGSQIYRFCQDHRGNGVQHAALEVEDIVRAVAELRERGVRFIDTPSAYYDRLPDRLAELGMSSISEDLPVLRELGILIDGEGPGSYLLQIFMDPVQRGEPGPGASPFFFELIQRKGDRRFGEGNFRALFEGIELKESSVRGAR
ncbi:4-hydroxyphenylpyruvate dioxygenase family protein [Sorangium sp. So ce861]|uniref:4-hydroxyphenylpyruvate dioxygenase family protein n=1 Tax=Sorangium sp. So ce861 TaxID=3133323 RepID=UPI003F6489BC